MYLDYDGYQELGGALDVSAFTLSEHRAGKLIQALTHGRASVTSEHGKAVCLCAYALIEAIAADSAQGERVVQSESNDGVSVTYAATVGPDERYRQIVKAFLSGEATAEGVSLLYAGVDA